MRFFGHFEELFQFKGNGNSDGAGAEINHWFLVILVIILRQTAPTGYTSDHPVRKRQEISAGQESKTSPSLEAWEGNTNELLLYLAQFELKRETSAVWPFFSGPERLFLSLHSQENKT